MSSKPGWTIVALKNPNGKPYLARAWDPHAKKYRNKSFDKLGQANAWGKTEAARLRAGLTQAGRAPIQDVIDEYLSDLERMKAAAGFQVEVKRVLASAVAAGVTDLRHPRVAQHAKEWLKNSLSVHPQRKGRPLSEATLNRYLRAIRKIGSNAVRQGRINRNPFLDIDAIPEPDDLKDVFRIDELARLVDRRESDRVYWLPMVLMIYTGCRLGEMLHMRWEWIDFKAKRIFVKDWRGMDGANKHFALKFKKERIIPLQPELATLIKKLAQHQGWVVSDKLRLASARGHLSRFKTYTQKVLGGRRDGGGNEIDVVGDRTPHSCRHCYIALSLASGENESLVQIYAGHNQLTTTATYGKSQVEYRDVAKKWTPGVFRLLAKKGRVKKKAKPETMETSSQPVLGLGEVKIA